MNTATKIGPEYYNAVRRSESVARRYKRAQARMRRGLDLPGNEPDLCQACGNPPVGVLALDHDHATGESRGYLCQRCNCGAGTLGDTTQDAAGLLVYMLRFERLRRKDRQALSGITDMTYRQLLDELAHIEHTTL